MKSTSIGLLAGIMIILYSILIGGDIKGYIDVPSMIIVFGGTTATLFISYSFAQLKKFASQIKEAFIDSKTNLNEDLERILSLANIARREGLLALDGQEFGNPFLQKGIELIVDGTDPDLFKDVMETIISKMEEQDQITQKILVSGSMFAPAFGMIGTLVGLVNMLANLNDASTLGPNMSIALITTFYGVVLANMVFLPLSVKCKTASDHRINQYQMMLEGMLSLQNGENPRIIREKLIVFIPKNQLSEPVAETIEEKGETVNAEEKSRG